MMISNLSALHTLPPKTRLLGLDVGTKRIGVALSDAERITATPLCLIDRAGDELQTLADLARTHSAGGFVIGMPARMDGRTGARAQASHLLGKKLGAHTKLPIGFWDERLSSVAVDRALSEARASIRARRTAQDKMAAAYILQGALDRLANMIAPAPDGV